LKNLILILLAVWLVCDPAANVTQYLIVESGVSTVVQAEPDGSLKVELDDWPDGLHDLQVRSKNIWGVSDPAPFSFTKGPPVIPTGLVLIAD